MSLTVLIIFLVIGIGVFAYLNSGKITTMIANIKAKFTQKKKEVAGDIADKIRKTGGL